MMDQMLRIGAPSLSHDGFEKAETDENRRQGLISKPAIRGAVHNLRIITKLFFDLSLSMGKSGIIF